jgi:hypothetical protein
VNERTTKEIFDFAAVGRGLGIMGQKYIGFVKADAGITVEVGDK